MELWKQLSGPRPEPEPDSGPEDGITGPEVMCEIE